MTPGTYRRPLLPRQQFRDADGAVIDYGNRWGMSGPPEHTYSVVSHPERFGPLTDVAQALIDHVVATYEVDVDDRHLAEDDRYLSDGGEDRDRGAGARQSRRASPAFFDRDDVTRAVLLQPTDPRAAPLTIGFTEAGILVQAGVLYESLMPGCGCDACDTSLTDAVEDLERVVLAVVGGRFREHAGRRWFEYAMTYPDGAHSARTRVHRSRRRAVRAARRRLRVLPDGWRCWPRR